jgi:hypothetical protein
MQGVGLAHAARSRRAPARVAGVGYTGRLHEQPQAVCEVLFLHAPLRQPNPNPPMRKEVMWLASVIAESFS